MTYYTSEKFVKNHFCEKNVFMLSCFGQNENGIGVKQSSSKLQLARLRRLVKARNGNIQISNSWFPSQNIILHFSTPQISRRFEAFRVELCCLMDEMESKFASAAGSGDEMGDYADKNKCEA